MYGSAALGHSCAAASGELLAHTSSANTARDLELRRQAVGDQGLSFLDYSYGTYVGASYANLFPDRTRAMVFDGALDLVANSTGRPGQEQLLIDVRADTARSQAEELDAFFDPAIRPIRGLLLVKPMDALGLMPRCLLAARRAPVAWAGRLVSTMGTSGYLMRYLGVDLVERNRRRSLGWPTAVGCRHLESDQASVRRSVRPRTIVHSGDFTKRTVMPGFWSRPVVVSDR